MHIPDLLVILAWNRLEKLDECSGRVEACGDIAPVVKLDRFIANLAAGCEEAGVPLLEAEWRRGGRWQTWYEALPELLRSLSRDRR